MTFRVDVGRRATDQIREASSWWVANRSKASAGFAEDIESAFELLSALPGTGERVAHATIPIVRRLLVSRVRYYLYYSVDEQREVVEILALWHTSRGRPPDLG